MKKIAIIGATGFASERMIPEFSTSTIGKIAAIEGRDEEALKKIAKQYGIANTFTDIDEMLKADKYDAIYIATPPFLHTENIKQVIPTGTAILCEKPITLSLKDALEVEKLMQENNTVFMVGHHIRHQKAISDLKNVLDSKEIGDIISVSGAWGYQLDPNAHYAKWKLDPSKGGPNVMYDPGIHAIDLFYVLFGMPNKIMSTGLSILYPTTKDNMTAILSYNLMEATITCSQTETNPKNDLIIIGAKGTIEIPNAFAQEYIKEIHIKTIESDRMISYEPTLLYKNEMENLLGEKPVRFPGTTLNEAIEEMKILSEI